MARTPARRSAPPTCSTTLPPANATDPRTPQWMKRGPPTGTRRGRCRTPTPQPRHLRSLRRCHPPNHHGCRTAPPASSVMRRWRPGWHRSRSAPHRPCPPQSWIGVGRGQREWRWHWSCPGTQGRRWRSTPHPTRHPSPRLCRRERFGLPPPPSRWCPRRRRPPPWCHARRLGQGWR